LVIELGNFEASFAAKDNISHNEMLIFQTIKALQNVKAKTLPNVPSVISLAETVCPLRTFSFLIFAPLFLIHSFTLQSLRWYSCSLAKSSLMTLSPTLLSKVLI